MCRGSPTVRLIYQGTVRPGNQHGVLDSPSGDDRDTPAKYRVASDFLWIKMYFAFPKMLTRHQRPQPPVDSSCDFKAVFGNILSRVSQVCNVSGSRIS